MGPIREDRSSVCGGAAAGGGDALQRNGGIGASVDGAPELDECRTAGGEGEPHGGGNNGGREKGEAEGTGDVGGKELVADGSEEVHKDAGRPLSIPRRQTRIRVRVRVQIRLRGVSVSDPASGGGASLREGPGRCRGGR